MKESKPQYFPGEPELIQGGMGVGVSNWRLAREVALAGERLEKSVLGVVSGVALTGIMVNRLRNGDPDEFRAIRAFPVPEIADKIIGTYWRNTDTSTRYKYPPKPEVLINGARQRQLDLMELTVASNFTEVWLAKEGHDNPIGINYLEKVQVPHLTEIYGAMLAGVDYVLMGAGIPNQVPGVLDRFAANQSADYRIDVAGPTGHEKHTMTFDPKDVIPERLMRDLKRPKFLAIISHDLLARVLSDSNKVSGVVNGFVVEGPMAGGHNAPPRGKETVNGEPVYGQKDEPDLGKILQHGKPFWLAGGKASAQQLREAQEAGARGIQVGSAFALANESGIEDKIKRELRRKGFNGSLIVIASPTTSPTGFPFQVAQLEGSLSDPEVYKARERKCDYGFVAEAYKMPNGRIGFRCPAEPIKAYVAKGGSEEDTVDRKCLCSGLAATVGSAPGQNFIATLGKEYGFLRDLMSDPEDSYSAEDVIKKILP